MSEGKNEDRRISRRQFLKVALGASAATVATLYGLDKLKDNPTEKKEAETIKGSASADELLGPNYSSRDLKVGATKSTEGEGYIVLSKAPVDLIGGDYLIQSDHYYFPGEADQESVGGSNVSVKVRLLESEDGKTKYLQILIDNATGPTDSRKFNLTGASLDVGLPSDSHPETLMHDSQGIYDLQASMWEEKGSSFFIPIQGDRGNRAKYDNVVGWQTNGIPESIWFNLHGVSPLPPSPVKTITFMAETPGQMNKRFARIHMERDEFLRDNGQAETDSRYSFIDGYKQVITSEYGGEIANSVFQSNST